VLGSADTQFLHGAGATGTGLGHQDAPVAPVITGVANVLAGSPPTSELTSIGGLGKVFGPAGQQQGAGAGTPDGLPAPGTGSVTNLEDGSKPAVNNLLPPHH
jgi:hypothetical protein